MAKWHVWSGNPRGNFSGGISGLDSERFHGGGSWQKKFLCRKRPGKSGVSFCWASTKKDLCVFLFHVFF